MKKALIAVSVILNAALAWYILNRWYFPIDQSHTPQYAEAVRRFKEFPIHPDDVVLFGDSRLKHLTEGEFLTEYCPVINRSIGGETSGGLVKRVGEVISSHPRKVFIEIGVNDLWDRVTPDSLLKNMEFLVSAFKHRSPETRLYVLPILPTSVNHNRVDVVPLIVQANEGMRRLCAKDGVTFVDAYGAFADHGSLNKTYDSGDGIHLNDDGNRRLAGCLVPYLR